MATIKIELFTSKTLIKEEGRHPIYVTVRKDTPRRKKVGVAFVEEWDEKNSRIKSKGRKDHVAANIFIEDEFDKYKAIFNQLCRTGEDWTSDDVFAANDQKSATKVQTFYEVAEDFLNTLVPGSGTYDGAKARLEKVKRFKPKDFTIASINDAWITGFANHCKTKEKNKEGGIGNSKNTIVQSFKFVKRIVSFSGQENLILKKFKLSKTKTTKRKLTLEEVNLIANIELPAGTIKYHARNIFLVQFYLRGMRIGDALRLEASDISGNRLTYDARKTEVNYDMKIVEPCMNILMEYINNPSYIFPILRIHEDSSTIHEFKNELKNRTQIINRRLNEIAQACGIEKRVSTHIARHSFGSIADKQLGGNLKTLQGLFGHSSRAMTEGYIADLRATDDLDDAADKVLG